MARAATKLAAVPTPLNVLELPVRDPAPETERRASPRAGVCFDVTGTESRERYLGVDLSFGGMLCIGDEPLWPGNIGSFELALQDGDRPLVVVASVAGLVPHEKGIAMRLRFENLDAKSRRRVASLVAALSLNAA